MPETKEKPKTKTKSKKSLGRGLDAFFGDIPVAEPVASTGADFASASAANVLTADAEQSMPIRTLKVRDVEPNPDQPRKTFEKAALEALAESIKEHGLIQPILVKAANNGVFTIIAGERRWRAAKLAGLKEIQCRVADYSERESMEIALVENLQREDLNPIEEAEGYQKLMDTFSLTQEEVSEKVGKSRSAVANAVRLNKLSDTIKKMVSDGKISSGHARAILSLDKESDRLILAEQIEQKSLNVRQAEAAAAAMLKNKKQPAKKATDKNLDAYFKNLANDLSKKLETKVSIKQGKKRGKIEIEYYSNDDLENILQKFK